MNTMQLTTHDYLTAVRSGTVDLSQHVARLISLIESEDTRLHAMVPGTFSRDRIEAEVDQLLCAFPDVESRPSLFGLPIGVKDIIRVSGLPTRCGSRLPEALFDGAEATCVTRLKQEGAIVLGKTVTTEFAAFQPGPTRNPHNLSHTPGGSSSGSAAGVASGFFPFAFGTQTIGSIARPAAFCGVVGFKPSLGRVSTDGVIEYSRTVDHVGWLSADSSALSQVASVLLSNWNHDAEPRKIEAVSFGVPEGPYLAQAAGNELQRFADILSGLQLQGLSIRSASALSNIEAMRTHHVRLVTAEMARFHRIWYQRTSGALFAANHRADRTR